MVSSFSDHCRFFSLSDYLCALRETIIEHRREATGLLLLLCPPLWLCEARWRSHHHQDRRTEAEGRRFSFPRVLLGFLIVFLMFSYCFLIVF